MAGLVSQLVELAKTEHITPVMDEVDFSQTVTGGILPFESVAFEHGLTLDFHIAEGLRLNGNDGQLGQLVSYYSLINTSNNSVATRNARNGIRDKCAYGIAQAVNDLFKCGKNLIMKASGTRFLSYLLNGVYFQRIVRNNRAFASF